MNNGHIILFVIIILLLILTLIAIFINEYKEEKQSEEEEKKRKNDIALNKKRATERKEREISIALKENEECIKLINKENLINCINYNINRPSNIIDNIPLGKKEEIFTNEKYNLLIETKKSIEHLFLKTKNIKELSIEEKIILNPINKEEYPLLNEKVHYNLLFDVFKCNPLNKSKLLKKSIEKLQYDLITELGKHDTPLKEVGAFLKLL